MKADLRILLCKSDRAWTGVCIDLGVSFQFERIYDLGPALIKAIEDTIEAGKEFDIPRKRLFEPMSKDFERRFEEAQPLDAFIDSEVARLVGDGQQLEFKQERGGCAREFASC